MSRRAPPVVPGLADVRRIGVDQLAFVDARYSFSDLRSLQWSSVRQFQSHHRLDQAVDVPNE